MNHRLFERTLHRSIPDALVCQVESLLSTTTPSAKALGGQWALTPVIALSSKNLVTVPILGIQALFAVVKG